MTKQRHFIVVLNDGTTYTSLDGCTIVELEESALVKLKEDQTPDDLDPEDVISVQDIKDFLSDATGEFGTWDKTKM